MWAKDSGKLRLNIEEEVDSLVAAQIFELQKICFPQVSENEADSDFYHEESAHVLAWNEGDLVGWAGIHLAETQFENQTIRFGGYGICIHPNWRRRGIAKQIVLRAFNYMLERDCELAFLSVDAIDEGAIDFHMNMGFVAIKRPFSWTDKKGEVKSDIGGMMRPLKSKDIFNRVLNSREIFHVGEGYW